MVYRRVGKLQHRQSSGSASSTIPPSKNKCATASNEPKKNHRKSLIQTRSTKLPPKTAAPRETILPGKKVCGDDTSLVG
ncbi:hypothetical protein PIB30_102089, partial [Stylosanthes scabra]|nr:hypothetical protein [Stylosanthes scabra]